MILHERTRLCISRRPGEALLIGRQRLTYMGIVYHRPRFYLTPEAIEVQASWDIETECPGGWAIQCNPQSGQRVQVIVMAPRSIKVVRAELAPKGNV